MTDGLEDARRVQDDAKVEIDRAERVTARAERLLLTITTAAKRLEVHPETLRRWIRQGKIPAHRYPSGQFRVDAAVVENIRTTPATTDNTSL